MALATARATRTPGKRRVTGLVQSVDSKLKAASTGHLHLESQAQQARGSGSEGQRRQLWV